MCFTCQSVAGRGRRDGDGNVRHCAAMDRASKLISGRLRSLEATDTYDEVENSSYLTVLAEISNTPICGESPTAEPMVLHSCSTKSAAQVDWNMDPPVSAAM